ncbi:MULTISPECIES: cob(I)yrinic acid a,c-diamide adenosyltransferase [unclassified Enterococcus]|uniref:cob(I)yrinic acid a,c-diamide adenosyltransferase n=1 Tax=unclassified Enterococcus TaxID=2608891 RepID=UPI001A9A965D|nr:cob(I)yrinic acid a,c-diamide adenosyltransferase [Enterococcus sp. DIV1271a]MBO1299238.1 cob(I)yrinic acid a,c-diamide adenosyltransferase [Enterococcus sp. DIV1271a]
MPIYTKTGDKGMTSLFDGTRVKKASLRVEVYGTFDECCAQISLAQKMLKNQESQLALDWIQNKLFQMNAELATATKTDKLSNKSDLISMEDIRQLEIWIDEKTAKLPPIHEFILPGKSLAGAQLHVARTVCRRGERVLDRFMENEEVRAELSKFANRLSDCLYSFAREADHEQEQEVLITKIIHRYQERVQQPKVKPDFEEIVHACIDHANCLSVPVSIAIVDKNGALKQFYRMDDALIVSESMAIKKAYTAVSMKADTHELTELVQPSQPLFQLETLSDGKLVTFGGGFLLKDGQGNIIGGIGVSGGRPDQDMAIASKGIKKFKERA